MLSELLQKTSLFSLLYRIDLDLAEQVQIKGCPFHWKKTQSVMRIFHIFCICFLGFTFKDAKIRWLDDAFCEFKRRVKELTGGSWFVSMEYRMQKLAEYLRGWMNYFGISSYYRPIPEIEHWLRRRIRM
jgi:RNA-directed DNA polymerase